MQRNAIAISSFEAFLSTFSNDCQTYHESVSWARPARIQQPASALTVTLTSFGSLARSATSSPSPPAKLQNPDVSATPPANVGTLNSDNARPKSVTSQVIKPTLSPPPRLAPESPLDSESKAAGPDSKPSIPSNANAPSELNS